MKFLKKLFFKPKITEKERWFLTTLSTSVTRIL